MSQSGSGDPRYYADGVWYDGTTSCLRCSIGPAVLAATYGALTGTASATAVAIASFDRAIHDHRQSDGAFGPAAAGEGGPGIQTALFAEELGTAYLVLGARLDAAHRLAWSSALRGAADYLVGNGSVAWYINGNINLAITFVMALTQAVTGEAKYAALTAKALSFAMNPPQGKFPGRGLVYTRTPTAADGSDGAAYFTETGGSGLTGYDPDYAVMQLAVVSTWFTLTGDPAALRLTNLLFNQLWPRVNKLDWTLDTSHGSRHADAERSVGFISAALIVLAGHGGRTDLRGYLDSYVPAITTSFLHDASMISLVASFGYGTTFPTCLLAMR
jgi:hypothetical protein